MYDTKIRHKRHHSRRPAISHSVADQMAQTPWFPVAAIPPAAPAPAREPAGSSAEVPPPKPSASAASAWAFMQASLTSKKRAAGAAVNKRPPSNNKKGNVWTADLEMEDGTFSGWAADLSHTATHKRFMISSLDDRDLTHTCHSLLLTHAQSHRNTRSQLADLQLGKHGTAILGNGLATLLLVAAAVKWMSAASVMTHMMKMERTRMKVHRTDGNFKSVGGGSFLGSCAWRWRAQELKGQPVLLLLLLLHAHFGKASLVALYAV